MRTRNTATFVLLGIVLVGLLVRLIHFQALTTTAIPARPLVTTLTDDHAFLVWGQAILAGDWLGRDTLHPFFPWMADIAPIDTWYQWWGGKAIFHQAPLYPYLLALLLALTQGALAQVLLVQLVIGSLQPTFMYFLARRIWDEPAGLAAAAITALYGPFVFYEGLLLRDWLAPLLEPLALIAILRAKEYASPQRWLLAGASVGLALLARETVLFLLVALLCWVVATYWGKGATGMRAVTWLTIGLLLSLSPLFIRNAVTGAPIFSFSNRAAEGFIEGWAADGFPVGLYHPASMKNVLLLSDGHLLSVMQTTLATYHGDWGQLLQHLFVKVRGLIDPFEYPNNMSFYYGVEVSPILRFLLTYGVVFPLGIAGALVGWNRSREPMMALLYGAGAVVGLMSTVILSRYRLDLATSLILFAGACTAYLVHAAHNKQVRALLPGLAILAVAGLSQHVLLPLPEETKDYVYAFDYEVAADVYAGEGDFERAALEIQRALRKAAQHPNSTIALRGGDGEIIGAFVDVDALRLKYHFYHANQLLQGGDITEARREAEKVRESLAGIPRPDTHRLYALAHFYLKLNDVPTAIELLEKVVIQDQTGSLSEKAKQLLADLNDHNPQPPN